MSNFGEALLRAYHVLRPQYESISVVGLPLDGPREEHPYDPDMTPHMKLAERDFTLVCSLLQFPCSHLMHNREAIEADIPSTIIRASQF
jgi:hypothetical protein